MSTTPRTTRAVVVREKGQAKVQTFKLRPLEPHEVRVANSVTALSVGNESLICSGQFEGTVLPCLLGYQGVGRVAELGREVSGFKVGDRVCSGVSRMSVEGYGQGTGNAHQSHPIVSDTGDWSQTVLPRVPEGVADEEAAYAWIAATALQAVRMGRVGLGDVIAVVGLGMVGQLVAQLCRLSGARVFACDLLPDRVTLASEHSADVAVEGNPDELNPRIREDHSAGADVVIECTGSSAVLDGVMNLAAREGRVVLTGTFPDEARFRFFPCQSKKLTLFCAGGWGDLRPVLRLLAEERLKIRPFISYEATPNDVSDLYRRVYEKDPSLMGAVIRWS